MWLTTTDITLDHNSWHGTLIFAHCHSKYMDSIRDYTLWCNHYIRAFEGMMQIDFIEGYTSSCFGPSLHSMKSLFKKDQRIPNCHFYCHTSLN